MDRSFFIATIGCKVNWCDSERIAAAACAAGWRRAVSARDADVCVVNTCTVTAHADATARKIARQARRENPAAPVILAGCLPRVNGQAAMFDGVNAMVASHSEADVVAAMAAALTQVPGTTAPSPANPPSAQRRPAARTRAFVKVQDGCDQRCAYCIVPRARGAARSVPLAQVLDEVAERAREGFKEIILAGINLATYADGAARLPDLLHAVAKLDAVPRIRLSSVEANAVDARFLEIMATQPSIMPHLHVPLQSGSNRVLDAMNRKVTADMFLDAVRLLRSARPDATATTDVIVGFPGETEDDVGETLDVVRRAECAKVHVFPFSPRPGTAAALLKPRVQAAIVREREQRLLDCAHALAVQCRARFVGVPLSVLIEAKRRGAFEGFSQNYLRVRTMRPDLKSNDIVILVVDGTTTEFVATP